MPESSIKNLHSRKKSKKIKICVKTEREQEREKPFVRPQVSGVKFNRTSREQKNKNLRHTSMITTKNEEIKKLELQSTLPLKRKLQNESKLQRKLPEIYQPQLKSDKIINIDLNKMKQKTKSSSTCDVIESRKTQSNFNEQRKPDLGRKSINFRLTQLQPLKQLDKEQKKHIFKIIRNQFHELINSSNNLSVKNPQYHFKAYVQKGNNGVLVKQLLKKRWWWHIEEKDPSRANLIWSEWFNKSFTQEMEEVIKDKDINYQQYRSRPSEELKSTKQVCIKKMVDDFTFTKIQEKINFKSNNYFTGRNERLLKYGKDEVKQVKVELDQIIHNHVDGCLQLHSKKLLFKNFYDLMKKKQWDPFSFMPLTFYIDRVNSQSVQELLRAYDKIAEKQESTNKNIWICKPGQNSNRGFGITVVKERERILKEIEERLSDNTQTYQKRTVIFQKYLQNCFLIKNRKFDIRCYIMLTTVNGMLKGYWYRDGYIRTSSEEYDLNDIDNTMIHLTNDAIQKKGESFGKFQDNNKMSFETFKKYLQKVGQSQNKFDETYEQMKLISYYMITSVSSKIKRKQFTFQLFGLDFMLDDNLMPYLIQANSNPSLNNTGKIMGSLIHHLVENVIMTAIDPIFPPPSNMQKKPQYISIDYFENNRFELIYTDKIGQEL